MLKLRYAALVAAGLFTTASYAETSTVITPVNVLECKATTEDEIGALFDRWNGSLATGDSKKVVENYATDSILLPTVSNKPRFSPAEKEDYFDHFLEKRPQGKIDERFIQIGCNTALDAGLYTFTFNDGSKVSGRYSYTYRWTGSKWLITHHHSSAMPEKATAATKGKKGKH